MCGEAMVDWSNFEHLLDPTLVVFGSRERRWGKTRLEEQLRGDYEEGAHQQQYLVNFYDELDSRRVAPDDPRILADYDGSPDQLVWEHFRERFEHRDRAIDVNRRSLRVPTSF